MAVKSNDKILLGAALSLVVASAAVFGVLASRRAARPSVAPVSVQLATTPYVAAVADATVVKTDTWNQPVAQSRGRDWIYDTFTPPEIFYSARSKQFTVRPPSGLADDDSEEAFGLELVSIRPEAFRLQLIGYVGGEGNWRGTFENVLSGEVFLATAGRRVPNLALSIVSLEVRPQPVVSVESMTTNQRVATAVVRDEKNGRNVTLTQRERRFTGTVFAFVAVAGEAGTREVRLGDAFKVGDETYHIDKITASPPSIEVTKESPTLAQPDRRTLLPRDIDDSPPPPLN